MLNHSPHQTFVTVYALKGPAQLLTYSIPENLTHIKSGMLIEIPLGFRKTIGLVTEIHNDAPTHLKKLKNILQPLYPYPVLSQDLLSLIPWIAKYYDAPLNTVLETCIPSAIRFPVKEKQLITVTISQIVTQDLIDQLQKRSPKQADALRHLNTLRQPIEKKEAIKIFNISPHVYEALKNKNYLLEQIQAIHRIVYEQNTDQSDATLSSKPLILNEEQTTAVTSIHDHLKIHQFKVHLLHGITGSGKTEVYIEAAKKALSLGGSVLMLVPEVALAPQTVARLRSRLEANGLEAVVLHSHLSQGEKMDAWLALAKGTAKIVVGARSAVFAPLQNLKLIIVDEEHESAYKQEETPRYHGRDVAIYRAKLNDAICVLGSATPSLESLYNIEKKGFILNTLTKRIDDRILPPMHIVDMRHEGSIDKGTPLICKLLLEKLHDRLEKKEQSILFLNRRGYAPKILCKTCGHVITCPHCSISLTFHQHDTSLRCHLCQYQIDLPKKCPSCYHEPLHEKGYGTQRIENILPKLLPGIRLERLDADTLNRKERFRNILGDFRKGKLDILIGTQIIAKGFDFPNVTLVGVLDADLSLHMPDFRASERTFQLLVQVAGRAGRGDRAGEVIIQTYSPSNAPIQFAKKADYQGFFAAELEERRLLQYPPYRQLIRHVFRGPNAEKVAFFIEQWTRLLEKHTLENLEIRGPTTAPREKIKDHYRYHLWYFTPHTLRTLNHIRALKTQFNCDKDIIDYLDVDPVNLG